jgi:hypothetical protein
MVFLAAAAVAPAHAEDAQELLNKMRDFNAVQVVYRQGVPHTDRRGRVLTKFDAEQSFFQIAAWGNPWGDLYGYKYDLKVLTDAGFNTMWPWPMRSLEEQLEAGKAAGLQVVTMRAHKEDEATKFKDHPNWLGNVWHDEPTGSFWGKDMEGKLKEFLDYRAMMEKAAPDVPVFINDVPWITAPATSWWIKWNTSGDVACHDNYPLLNRKYRARTLGDEESKSGIPSTVSLAAAANKEQKPVWFIVGAFTTRGAGGFPFRFPTPMQLRAQVYAALIHGATGIIYFCWDTYVCRDGDVIGMSPDPQAVYFEAAPGRPKTSPARPMQLAESKAAWMAAAQVNTEIRELTPSLFSPTVGDDVKYTAKVEGTAVTDAPLRCLLKPHPEGGYVLLTVNLDDAVLNATYEFPAGLKSVEPLFENRDPFKLEAGQKSFADRYEPFEAHVYRIRAGG